MQPHEARISSSKYRGGFVVALTLPEFIALWQASTCNTHGAEQRSAAQERFLDLCKVLGLLLSFFLSQLNRPAEQSDYFLIGKVFGGVADLNLAHRHVGQSGLR